MTKKELVEKLAGYDDDFQVVLVDQTGTAYAVDSVEDGGEPDEVVLVIGDEL